MITKYKVGVILGVLVKDKIASAFTVSSIFISIDDKGEQVGYKCHKGIVYFQDKHTLIKLAPAKTCDCEA